MLDIAVGAAPAFVVRSSAVDGSSGTTQAVPAIAGGLGKFGVMMILSYSSKQTPSGVPAGWTHQGTVGGEKFGGGDGSSSCLHFYTKTALAAGDIAGFNVTFSPAVYFSVVIAAYDAPASVDSVNVFEITNDAAATGFDPTAVAVAGANSKVIYIAEVMDDGSGTGIGPAGGVTERLDTDGPFSVTQMGLWDAEPGHQAAYQPHFTYSGSGVARYGGGMVVVITNASAAGGQAGTCAACCC